MVLLAVVAETDDQGRDLHGRGFRMEPYGGPLQYMYLSMFLLQRAQALGYGGREMGVHGCWYCVTYNAHKTWVPGKHAWYV